MYAPEREDQLLMKLQKCIGKIQPKSYDIPKRKQSSFSHTPHPKNHPEQENLHKYDQPHTRYQSIRKKQPQYQRTHKYADRKHELKVDDWKPRRNNENYIKELGQTMVHKGKKNDMGLSGAKNMEYEHREVLGTVNSTLNTHRNSFNNQTEVLRPSKPSYENYKTNKNIQKQISFQSPIRKKDDYEGQKLNENPLRRNYQVQQYNYDKSDSYLPLQRSRFEERVERKQVKKQPVNEDALYSMENSSKRYDRKTFSAIGQLRENNSRESSKFKNIGAISTQNRIKQCSQLMKRSREKVLCSPSNNESFERSRLLERSRRMEGLGEQRSVRKELEEVALGKNQDTFYKLRKIGELNDRINQRIKKIIETFEHPQH